MFKPLFNEGKNVKMKKIMLACVLAFCVSNIFAQGGTVPTGLPNYFGFGTIDKADTGACCGPQFWKDGQTCWDYSYQYLTPGWAGWVSGGGWATNEMKHWETSPASEIQVFTFYYTPCTLSNYTTASWMNTYFSDFKLLMQNIAASNLPKVVIVHIEPDFLGYMRQKGTGSYNQSGLVKVGSSGFSETDDGVAFSSLPDTLQGWSEAFFRVRNQYARGKVLLAHHFTHWATGADIFAGSQAQSVCDTNVDDMCNFIKNVEGSTAKAYDLFFVNPADRDADWYKIKNGDSTRWTDASTHAYSNGRSWGKIGYITDRISTNLARRGMFWQIPVGNTYYKTCNNSANHYRDNSAQEFLPSTTTDGSAGTPRDAYSQADTTKGPGFWANHGIIGVLFGEGGYDSNASPHDMTHIRDWPTDGTTNPASDGQSGGMYALGKATSSVADNEGGYLRAAIAKYCSNKFPLSGTPPVNTPTYTSVPSKTNTPQNTPSFTYTRTQTGTPTFTRTSTLVVPSATPTFTSTRTNTLVVPSATPTFTSTVTNTPVIPTATPTFTSTRTSTSVVSSPTFTSTYTIVIFSPTYTVTPQPTATRTNTIVPPTSTNTATKTSTPPPTATPTNPPPGATNTFTSTVTMTLIPTNTTTPTFTSSRTSTPPPTSTFTNTSLPSATPTNPPPGASSTYTGTYTPVVSPTFTVTKTSTVMIPTRTNTSTVTLTATLILTAVNTPVNTPTSTATIQPGATATAVSDADILAIPGPPVAFPNPNYGTQMTIMFDITRPVTSVVVRIYTVSRRLIRVIRLEGLFGTGKAAVVINRGYLTGLAKGTYLYQLTVKDGANEEAKSKIGMVI